MVWETSSVAHSKPIWRTRVVALSHWNKEECQNALLHQIKWQHLYKVTFERKKLSLRLNLFPCTRPTELIHCVSPLMAKSYLGLEYRSVCCHFTKLYQNYLHITTIVIVMPCLVVWGFLLLLFCFGGVLFSWIFFCLGMVLVCLVGRSVLFPPFVKALFRTRPSQQAPLPDL